jgi:hypothetical protein
MKGKPLTSLQATDLIQKLTAKLLFKLVFFKQTIKGSSERWVRYLDLARLLG